MCCCVFESTGVAALDATRATRQHAIAAILIYRRTNVTYKLLSPSPRPHRASPGSPPARASRSARRTRTSLLFSRSSRESRRPRSAVIRLMSDTCVEIKFYGAFALNLPVDLHAIDAPPARWRGNAGYSPLDGASTAASSPRNDLVYPTHSLISTQSDTRGKCHTCT